MDFHFICSNFIYYFVFIFALTRSVGPQPLQCLGTNCEKGGVTYNTHNTIE